MQWIEGETIMRLLSLTSFHMALESSFPHETLYLAGNRVPLRVPRFALSGISSYLPLS